MADQDEPGTHIVFQGKHYVISGPKLSPDEARLRLANLLSAGPKMSAGRPPTESELADERTSGAADAQRILKEHKDPNNWGTLAKAVAFAAAPSVGAALAGPAASAMGGTLGRVAPFVPRAIAGAQGAQEGYRLGNKAAGTPGGVAGAVIGGAAGAAAPPAVANPALGAVTGYETGGPGGAVLGGLIGLAFRGKAPAAKAASEAAEVAPAAAVAKAAEIETQIKNMMVRKLSGAQMESALRNIHGISPKDGRAMIQLVREAEESALQAPRIQVGAQKVGRELGMTKEEVRKVAGPVLGEARGEASPILPKKALQNIIDTMKSMPMEEREAYVARATSGKAQWQIENIRRTLEHLGLLLPVGAAGAVAASEED